MSDEIKGYFTDLNTPLSDERSGKLGGEPHHNMTAFRSFGTSRQCKYFDEKDPHCNNTQMDPLTGCCIYHRHKYNELVNGERTNRGLLIWMINIGVLKDGTELTEWKTDKDGNLLKDW